jgi:hypothetical protein
MTSPNPSPKTSTDLSPMSAECALPETFSVDNAAGANWVVRKIIEARNYAKHVKQWAEAEILRAQREEEFFLFHYGHQLEIWARSQIASGKRKSVKLPGGTVGFRVRATKLEITDKKALLEWCKTNCPSSVMTVETVLKKGVMSHVKDTGECPAGAEIKVGSDHLYIR